MTSPGDAGAETLSSAGSRRAPTWPRFAVIAAVFVLALLVAKNCQDEQIEVTEAEAVAIAGDQVDFDAKDTQIRLLRQGIERQPFWIVSLSIPSADGQTYDELAVIRIDATSGQVVEARDQSVKEEQPRGAEAEPQGR